MTEKKTATKQRVRNGAVAAGILAAAVIGGVTAAPAQAIPVQPVPCPTGVACATSLDVAYYSDHEEISIDITPRIANALVQPSADGAFVTPDGVTHYPSHPGAYYLIVTLNANANPINYWPGSGDPSASLQYVQKAWSDGAKSQFVLTLNPYSTWTVGNYYVRLGSPKQVISIYHPGHYPS